MADPAADSGNIPPARPAGPLASLPEITVKAVPLSVVLSCVLAGAGGTLGAGSGQWATGEGE